MTLKKSYAQCPLCGQRYDPIYAGTKCPMKPIHPKSSGKQRCEGIIDFFCSGVTPERIKYKDLYFAARANTKYGISAKDAGKIAKKILV